MSDPTCVEFDDVVAGYGELMILNHLSLRARRGKVTLLLGPNGAGKSTLLQLATGQLRPSQGTVRVLGQSAWDNPALNRQVGINYSDSTPDVTVRARVPRRRNAAILGPIRKAKGSPARLRPLWMWAPL